VIDPSGLEWGSYANLHDRSQAVRIERVREVLKADAAGLERSRA